MLNDKKEMDSLFISLKTKEFLKKGKKIKKYPYTPDLHKKFIKTCFVREGQKCLM